jgi:hypothetical protein
MDATETCALQKYSDVRHRIIWQVLTICFYPWYKYMVYYRNYTDIIETVIHLAWYMKTDTLLCHHIYSESDTYSDKCQIFTQVLIGSKFIISSYK